MDNFKAPDTSQLQELIVRYSHFFAEIRRRIISVFIVFLCGAAFGLTFNNEIIKFLIDLLSLKGVNIVFTSPFQFINLAFSTAFAVGIVFVFPLLIFQVLSFLRPALRKKEFRVIVRFLPISIFLFLSGFLLGFWIMKWQIEIFLQKSLELGIGNVLDISRLISTVLLVAVLMGMAFQFPIVIFLLTYIGILKVKFLKKQRLWVYLGSLVFAILLPADSILADFLLALPLVILFEMTLILSHIFGRKKSPKQVLAST